MLRSSFRAIVLLAFLGSAPLSAQILPFRDFVSRDGLLSNYVLALCTDSIGNLWIGSNDGLSRYDGISFTNYTVANGLSFSRVTCLEPSRLHPAILWIGTNGGGVCRFERGHFTTYSVGTTTWTNTISDIVEDARGQIWAATSEGVFSLSDSAFVRLSFDFPKTEQFGLLAMPDNAIWIITDHQIFSHSTVTHVTQSISVPLAPKEVIQAASVDPDKSVWLATSAGRLLHLQGMKVEESIETGASISTFIIRGIHGTHWVGTSNGILRITLRPGHPGSPEVVRYSTDNGLKDPYIVSGVLDREGDLWLGYYAHGIAQLSDYSIETYPLPGLSFPPNNSTAVSDRNNHVWVCSEAGLMEYWNDAAAGWKSRLHTELSKKKHKFLPWSITLDPDETLWMVLEDGSIHRYKPTLTDNGSSKLQLLKALVPGRQFPKSKPMFVYGDDNGLLWCSMAENRGIYLLNPQKRKPYLRQYTTANGLPDMSVRAIYEDRHGNLWFGGYSDGLTMLPADESLNGHFRRFTTTEGLPNNAIRAIMEDSSGTLWVGTRYGGLAYFQDSVFHGVSLNEGLLSTAVWCLARGKGNQLWVGTQLGMQLFQPGSHTFSTNYDWDIEPIYSGGQTSQGILWFVSPAGLALHDASEDREDSVPPPIEVRQFGVNGVPFPTSGSFELSSSQDNCSIEVAAVSLQSEGTLFYQYRLVGARDEAWSPPTQNRTFVFASLSPGAYTFMARALNASGIASIAPATIQFTIHRPYWQQWWFAGGVVLCIILLTVFIVRVRLSRLLAIEKLRAGIATDLHDDVGSGLTRIAILTDVAYSQVQEDQLRPKLRADDSNEVLGALEKIRSTARGLIETMSDVVWAIDPSHDSLERLVQRLRLFAYELCEGKNIALQFHSSNDVASATMSTEATRNVLLLTKEALTNIAKHAHCTRAEVAMWIANRHLLVEISDNGRGFDPAQIGAGNGLLNMKKRTRHPGSSLDVRSEPGKGTHITAAFPLLS